MRYLNKIVFINSAHIKYAEINLDGNVHFIGTQGVGKSALLRAILFFYNADSLGLGIPKQKSAYVDYYFNLSNSYIIYEVAREDGHFCVVSYKSQHKVCYRFYNGEYKKDFFVDENGHVPDSWESIAQKLDANRIFYTKRKIDEYIDYRNIIYGANEGKKHEYRRYSILESKDYQHVPKTIQNVFLNSKMEAEFIKQTIILSLDNDVRIDLNKYAYNLNDFETQLTDLRRFKMPSTSSQAESIAKLHISIRHLEREKIALAKELSWAVNENERKEPELTERLASQRDKETTVKTRMMRVKELFEEKAKRMNGDIRLQEENLKKAKSLAEYYVKENIERIIARVEKKNDWESEITSFDNEKSLLSAQFADLETKYKAMFDALGNRQKDFSNSKNAEKNNLNAGLLTFIDQTTKKSNKLISDFREDHKTELEYARTNWEDTKYIVNTLKIKKEGIRLTRFFENEIEALEKDIQERKQIIEQLPKVNEHLQKQIETIHKQWELDEQNLQKDFDRHKERIDEKITALKKQITEIELYIKNSKDSLYSWLTENYPNWELSIGKVVDDKNVLFNPSLHPRLVIPIPTTTAPIFTGNLYGVEVDLSEITKTVKTVNDYEAEKADIIALIQSHKKNLAELFEKIEDDKEKLKKKYQPKIREKIDEKRENDYLLEQSRLSHSDLSIRLNNQKIKSLTERENQLSAIDIEIDKSIENAKIAELEVSRVENEQNKIIKAKEKERDKTISAERDRIFVLLKDIEAEVVMNIAAISHQRQELINRKNRELSEKGADTKRINEIDDRLQTLSIELKFINDHFPLVVEYRKDKREFIDKISVFKQEKQKLEKLIESERQKFDKQYDEIAKELLEIQEIMADLDNMLKIIKEDLACFIQFKDSFLFVSLTEYFVYTGDSITTNHSGVAYTIHIGHEKKSEKRVTVLVDEIRDHFYKLQNRKEDLRTISTEFLSKFSENNIFKFKKHLTNEADYLAFAEMLTDFVEERKIEQIEKEVNERFALIVSTIGQETSNMQAESGKIQSLVAKINNDFMERDFGKGIIKKIELKIEDSKNEIVQLLVLIKKFNDENAMNFGPTNLFSTDNQDKKNKVAVDLLKQFVKKINDQKRDIVSLSDSFELKFRVIENQNDTGWVEKLSNVGSEGTDTLVKAMVNIMLLNVFKGNVSKLFKDFRLHCMMDEIGKLHPTNVRGILKFANDRNIMLINSSPIENDALAFTHIYKLQKDDRSITRIKRILTQLTEK